MVKIYKKISEFLRNFKKEKMNNIKLNSGLTREERRLKNSEKIEKIKTELEIRKTEKELKEQDNTIKTGKTMFKIACFGAVTSLILSLCGGIKKYEDSVFELIAFVLAMTIIQIIVFVISTYESRLIGHYGLKIIQIVALFLSIDNSYNFFKDKTITNLILCMLLDIGTVALLKKAHDFKNLIHKNKKGIIGMFLDNKTFNIKTKIIGKYEENNNNKEEEVKQEIHNNNIIKFEKKEETVLHNKLDLSDETLEYIGYITTNNENGFVKGYKTISKEVGISEARGKAIHNELIGLGIITVENKKTKLLNEKEN